MKEVIRLGPIIIMGKVPVMGKIYGPFILLFDNEVVGLLLGIVLYVVHCEIDKYEEPLKAVLGRNKIEKYY